MVSMTFSPAARNARPVSVPSTMQSTMSGTFASVGAVGEADVGGDALLLEVAAGQLGVLGGHAHASGKVLDALVRAVLEHRDGDLERPRGALE